LLSVRVIYKSFPLVALISKKYVLLPALTTFE